MRAASTRTFLKAAASAAVIAVLALFAPSAIATGTAVTGDPNPAWPEHCGVDAVLLIDHSNSIMRDNAANPGLMKGAAKAFADALAGTPSRLAVNSFWKTAQPEIGLTTTNAAGVAAVKSAIDGIPFSTSSSNGSTNWDEAFRSVESMGARIVIVLTDGNPTVYLNNYASGGTTDQADIDEGVKSANRVKSAGLDGVTSRVVAVGIGSGVSVPNLNLISGPNANDDYFTSNFATLQTKLIEIASKLCGGSLTAEKVAQNADGSYGDASGWALQTVLSGGSPPAVTADPSDGKTNGAGLVHFTWQSVGAQTATMTEEARAGFALESVVCDEAGQPFSASGVTRGVTLTLGPTDTVHCVFKNKRTNPAIEVVKTASPSPASIGQTVLYGYTVTNVGNLRLTNVALNDDKLGAITLGQTTLTPGQSTTGSSSHIVALGDFPGPITNIATAKGAPPSGPDVTDTDTKTVVLHTAPGITIEKTATSSTQPGVPDVTTAHAGDPIVYHFKVTNTGDVPLTNVHVHDSVFGDIPGSIPSLASGATTTLDFATTAGSDVANVATACGVDPLQTQVCDESNHHNLDVIHPAITLDKKVEGADHKPLGNALQIRSGDLVHYVVTIHNSGDTALSFTSLTDAVNGGGPGSLTGCSPSPASGLAVDTTITCSYTANPTADAHNVASVNAHDVIGGVATATDDTFVDVIHPAITVVKTATSTTQPGVLNVTTAHEGDPIVYHYKVTNTGDVTLVNVSVSDDPLGTVGVVASLAPGAETTMTFEAPAPAADFSNKGTACGTPPVGSNVCSDSTHTLDVIHPALIVEKTATSAAQADVADISQAHPGETVVYHFKVTNTGDVPLTNVHVHDSVFGDIPGSIASLAVGASDSSLSKSMAAPAGDVHNVGEACGKDPLQVDKCGSDDHTLDIINPNIDVTKSAVDANGDPITAAHLGDEVTYKFVVHNTGDVTLTNVSVDDNVFEHIGTIDSLAPDATQTLTKKVALTAAMTVEGGGAVDNTATACGKDPLQADKCDTDFHELTVLHPALTIDKKVGGGDHKPATNALQAHQGTDLGYTVLITNTGDAPLQITALSDSLKNAVGDTCGKGVGDTLAPDESTTCLYTTAAGANDAHNVVSVTGVDEVGGSTGTKTATDETFVDVIHPAIAIAKTANPATVEPGQSVDYTYVVTNTGDVALTNVAVTDDILGPIGSVASLAPGASTTITKTVTIQADSARTNVGTATGVDPLQLTVSATDKATISIVLPIPPQRRPVPHVTVTPPQKLPHTGFNLFLWIAMGLELIAAGMAMMSVRRGLRRA